MTRKGREAKLFTVRNGCGQYYGTYSALTAAQAIQKHLDAQRAYFATFRGSPKPEQLTAAVED